MLVATDHFTRYVQVFPTKNQKTITVAKTFGGYVFCALWPVDKDPF